MDHPDIASALVPIVALPAAVVASFIPMYYLGVSANIMSLGGIALAIGLLVDDAIVVLENIVRYVEQGMRPFEAAIRGATEISFTVISITVSLVAVVGEALIGANVVIEQLVIERRETRPVTTGED